ncbi:Clathrin/coatomer adaptor, adaptin-like protein [Chytriomyces sp. MP71]|nr:Clathrin/coatomer adaptor, adaptin-like protein [Chytriomyces sp. MP71]
MADAKFFAKGKVQEFRDELLAADKRDPKHTKKRIVLKKIVANMTMGNDMSPLFADVVAVMQTPMLEVKKMSYLYVVSYARTKPDLAKLTVAAFERDLLDPNPLIRALALRNMSYIQVDKIIEGCSTALLKCLTDKDPYVAKTAAICVVKLYTYDRGVVERAGLMDRLRALLNSDNSMVVANAVAALTEIAEKTPDFNMRMDFALSSKLLTAMNECSEWGQVYILESLLYFVPQDHNDAELVAERVMPRLQHANSAVVLSAIRVVLYMTNYILKDDLVASFFKRIGPPLVTLLHSGAEVQYVALRNIQLILQRKPDFLKSEIKVFFCKYNDPIYIKISKLEIMFRLVTEENIEQVLNELKEYATEIDVDFVRKSIRAIGKCAIKIESAADRCIRSLVDLIKTKVNYVVQESIVVIKDIFRRYPNKYEGIITTLCENLDSLDEAEAKASMIWIIGHYSDRIENADELLAHFLEPFKEETPNVQLALLTAIVKLFIRRPTKGQELIPKVLKWSTEDVDNPDLRDRGFIYWRLLSTDPVAAKAIVFSDSPPVTAEMENLPGQTLEELFLHISTLASIYHKTPETFIGGLRQKKVEPSAAFVFRDFAAYRGHLDEDVL